MISYCFSSENVEEAALKSHIFIFWNQKLRVDNSELLNLHKRLSIQSLKFEKYRPMSTVCQHLYTLGAVVCFNCGNHFLSEPYYDLAQFTIFIYLVTQEGGN